MSLFLSPLVQELLFTSNEWPPLSDANPQVEHSPKHASKHSPKALDKQKRIEELVKKYSIFNSDYERSKDISKSPPQLLDAVSSGFAVSVLVQTFNKYSDEIGEDIKDIVRLMPNSIFCNMGRLRLRENLTPLAMACHNPNIPLNIIKFLLESGCDPTEKIYFNGNKASIITSLKGDSEVKLNGYLSDKDRKYYQENLDRANAIEKIFEEHIKKALAAYQKNKISQEEKE